MSEDSRPPAPLDDAVARRRRQRQRWQAEGERPLGRNLVMIGFLGWVIVTPTLLGILAGRWLDQRLGTGITFAGGLLVAGLALGCWLAWVRIHRE